MIRINDKRFLVLGLTIVIASVFLGTFFASRYKSLNVSAVGAGACTCSDGKGNPVAGSCSGSNCNCGSNEQRTNKCGQAPGGGVIDDGPNSGCGLNQIRCASTDARNNSYSFCIASNGSEGSCNQAAADRGYVILIGNATSGNYGNKTYFCPPSHPSGVGCDPNNGGVESSYTKNSCFCGVIQIDTPNGFTSYRSSCGCNNDNESNPTPNPTPTIRPTSTPTSTPTNTPTTRPTPTTTPTNSPTPTNTPIPTSTPTGVPNSCGGTCGSNTNCQGGLFCLLGSGQTSGYCRNPECAQEADCKCKSTSTPPAVLGQTAPPALPKTGGSVVSQISLVGIAALGFFLFKRFKLN